MISMNDVRIENTPRCFIYPSQIAGDLHKLLRKAGIEFECYHWRKVRAGEVPETKGMDLSLQNYIDRGFTSSPLATALISYANPDDLFKKACLLFGPDMDPDLKAEKAYWEKRSHEGYLRDHADEVGIPIAKSSK